MSCNDILEKLEFKPYFFEPLRSMEKRATIRKSDKRGYCRMYS